MKPMKIILSGPQGCGKSVLVTKLIKYFLANDKSVEHRVDGHSNIFGSRSPFQKCAIVIIEKTT